MKRLLLIYNPQSGDGRVQSSLSELVDFFTKNKFEVTVYPTQAPGEAETFLQDRAPDFDRVIVCGGDGMMHEALNGWLRCENPPVLGYIPTGTVNDFAASHEIPRDILAAAQIAVNGEADLIDVGNFNGEYFSYVAAFGIATSVSYNTPHEEKKRLGSLAYVLRALSTVDFTHWENNCMTTKITWESGSAQGDFLYGMVSNSRYVGGMDSFTKNFFDWHDGQLEGIFIRRPMNLFELNQIIASIARSDFGNPMFIRVQSPWFEFSGDETPWTLDGEYGGSHSQVRTEAVHRAFLVSLPGEGKLPAPSQGKQHG